jgi:AraC-like DNA-binding protein
MDAVSDILNTLEFDSCLYFTTDFSPPWAINVPNYQSVVRFHLLTSGQCWVKINGKSDYLRLSAGDIIVIPHGASHILSDNPNTEVVELDAALDFSGYKGDGVFQYGGDNTTKTESDKAQLVCGHFQFDERFKHALVAQLPDLILISNHEAMKFPWFTDALRALSYETQTKRIGNESIIKRISEVIFIHSIRVWSEREKHQQSFLLALSDDKIGKSLQAFHDDPSKKWSLQSLASEAGLSRTLYSQRFKELTGDSVMHYVTQWRAQKAQKLLLDSKQSVEEVAENIGYDS